MIHRLIRAFLQASTNLRHALDILQSQLTNVRENCLKDLELQLSQLNNQTGRVLEQGLDTHNLVQEIRDMFGAQQLRDQELRTSKAEVACLRQTAAEEKAHKWEIYLLEQVRLMLDASIVYSVECSKNPLLKVSSICHAFTMHL